MASKFQQGQRVVARGIGHAGEVTEVVPSIGSVRFRSDRDGLVRQVDTSAVEPEISAAEGKAVQPSHNKARMGARNK